MNKVNLIGRLTRDPEIKYTQNGTCVGRYTIAIDRRHTDGEPAADFISIVAFGKSGEFAEKYMKKGMKIAISGRIQTGSYTNKDGIKVYTTEVVAEEQEFCEGKKTQEPQTDEAGFMNVPEGDDDLPFAQPTR